MSKFPTPLYDTRKNYPDGLQWRGYVYESVPQLAHRGRIMIVEDHDDYLLVSDYCRPCGWHERCKPTGELYRVNRIGPGRPTKGRIDLLKTELTARSQWSQAT